MSEKNKELKQLTVTHDLEIQDSHEYVENKKRKIDLRESIDAVLLIDETDITIKPCRIENDKLIYKETLSKSSVEVFLNEDRPSYILSLPTYLLLGGGGLKKILTRFFYPRIIRCRVYTVLRNSNTTIDPYYFQRTASENEQKLNALLKLQGAITKTNFVSQLVRDMKGRSRLLDYLPYIVIVIIVVVFVVAYAILPTL